MLYYSYGSSSKIKQVDETHVQSGLQNGRRKILEAERKREE
jgi:hypothetical protein